MKHRYLVMASALLLGACQTVHEVGQRSSVWEATYPVAYDAMATCLAGQWAHGWKVVPQIDPKEQRAVVMIGVYSAVVGEYAVQSSPTGTRVAWRQAYQYPLDSRDKADRCAGLA